MTKADLIELIAHSQPHFEARDVELIVKALLEQLSSALAAGERIEIRGFGSFSVHHRASRIGRNPKTGEPVALPTRCVPHFRPGKQLRERVNAPTASPPPGRPPVPEA